MGDTDGRMMSMRNLGIGLARIRTRTWNESIDIQDAPSSPHVSTYSEPRPNTPSWNALCRQHADNLLPPLKNEVMFLVRSVCLSVCLSVCPSDYSQTCERILTKFFGGVGHGSGPSDIILVAIRITLRIRESKVRNSDPPDRRKFVLSEYF